jgi:multimeric flavodoxin WrbA
MKALLVNGSPNEHKCTYTALQQVEAGLKEGGISCEWFWLGKDAVRPCVACGKCGKTGRCAFDDDCLCTLADAAVDADALVFGSPVYYAGINGSLKSALDRLYYSVGSKLAYKPGGAVVSARRAGTTAALEQLNKYFIINNQPLAGSGYWPMVHGNTVDEVMQDKEGLQVARQMGSNIAWMLNCIEAGCAAGIKPKPYEKIGTNFIR